MMKSVSPIHPLRLGYPMLFAMLALVVAAAGCGDPQDNACDTDADCFQDETCQSGTCAIRVVSPSNNTSSNNTSTNNTSTNNTSTNHTSTNNSNNTTTNNTSTNNSNNTTPALACIVNPFTATCDDPEPKINNDWSSGVGLNDGRNSGCPTGDSLVPVDEVYSGILCHNEPGDWFRLGLVHCDTRTFYIDVTLTPRTACDSDLFSMRIGGLTCEQDNVVCSLEEDGSYRMIVAIGPGRTVFGYNIGIEPADLGDASRAVQLEYDLHVVVR